MTVKSFLRITSADDDFFIRIRGDDDEVFYRGKNTKVPPDVSAMKIKDIYIDFPSEAVGIKVEKP